MPLLSTDAIVLHAFDYLESSRILRLATREAGVQSVLAKGLRRPKSRFGTAVDLFAGGTAHFYVKPGRELHTLAGFEVTNARAGLAADLGRFTGASAIVELVLGFVQDDAHPEVFDAIRSSLDAIAAADPADAREATLAAAWLLIGELGFAPALDACVDCQQAIDADATVMFSHPSGGALCERCAHLAARGRMIPPRARASLRGWLVGTRASIDGVEEARAHQRLLREFVREHIAGARALPAMDVWERSAWGGA